MLKHSGPLQKIEEAKTDQVDERPAFDKNPTTFKSIVIS